MEEQNSAHQQHPRTFEVISSSYLWPYENQDTLVQEQKTLSTRNLLLITWEIFVFVVPSTLDESNTYQYEYLNMMNNTQSVIFKALLKCLIQNFQMQV